ncbi:MAG: insulinase family protein [Deltaproteobacteria bacterium]|nr:insulinase family protein [Deltaproteobacteria bacterium]
MKKLFESKAPAIVDINAKRPGDERKFRSLTLKNELTVLLVSDPALNKSAAAMDVGVGSLVDPEESFGMAHFLEHLLFLGTKKYPEVDEYNQFLAQHQGFSNAFTDDENTNYFFEVNPDAFGGALDRFSQFFVEPLFDAHYVDRELHAVDSEHQKNLEKDNWRTQRVINLMYKKGHPRSKFSTGDKETLKNVERERLIEFYRNHYSANQMKLAVLAPLSLDELETMVKERFSEVPNHKLTRPHFDSDVFEDKELPRIVNITPVKELRKLELVFATPNPNEYWESKPVQALSHLVGYEAEGSLLSLLKKEGLAHKLGAGSEASTFGGLFHVDIELTEKGLQEKDRVLELFFSYIHLLTKEGWPRILHDERKIMSEIDYFYRDHREGGYVVSEYASRMHIHPPLMIDRRESIIQKYDEDEFKLFLSQIKPELMNAFLIAPDLKTDRTERFYGVSYGVTSVPPALLTRLKAATADQALFLPAPNPFIPQKLELLTSQTPTNAEKIIDNEWGTFWFQKDDTFHLPKANLRLVLLAQSVNKSPRDKVMSLLFVDALNESLNEWRYTIGLAGLHYDVQRTDRGIEIDIEGYSEKLPLLLDELSRRLTDITIDRATFEIIKKDLKRRIANTQFNSTYQKTLYELNHLSDKNAIHYNEYYKPGKKGGVDLISHVTLSQIKDFGKKELLKEIAIEGAAYGSLDAAALIPALQRYTTQFGSKILPIKKRPQEELIIFPKGSPLAALRHTPTNNNAWAQRVQFGKRDMRLNAALRIGHAHLESSFFTTLRTKQQLGYIVSSSIDMHEKDLGLLFLIQSSSFSPFEISTRVNAWMKGAVAELASISEEDFETYREAVIKELEEQDKTISEKLRTLYFEGITMKGHFHYKADIVKEARKLSKGDMLGIFKSALTGKTKASLSIYYSTEKTPKEKPKGTLIQDADAFKKKGRVFK